MLTLGGLPLSEYASFDVDGHLTVSHPDLAASLDRPYMSVSSAKSLHRCPAQFAADRALARHFDLFGAAEIGNAAHTIMERLLQLPSQRRTEQNAAALLVELAREEPPADGVDYAKHLGTDPVRYAQWIAAVQHAYTGLFKIEDPRDVDLVAAEFRLDNVQLEGVPFFGFIDRVDRIDYRGEKVLRVVDYKTGSPKLKKPTRFDDDHGDQVQIYVEAFQTMTGERPKRGVLYYTQNGGGQRAVAVARNVTSQTVTKIVVAWAELQRCRTTNSYPARTSALCGWCPLVNVCPSAHAAHLSDRKGGAPSAEDLGFPTPVTLTVTPPTGGEVAGHDLTEPPTEQVTGDTTEGTVMTETMDQPMVWPEAKPFDDVVLQTRNGNVPNLSSYAAGTAYGLTALAVQLLDNAKQPLTQNTIRAMADTLATMHRKIQYKVTGGDHPNMGAATRMSGAMRTAIELCPPPFGAPMAEFTAWVNQVVNRAVAIATIANSMLVDGPNSDYPWRALAAPEPHTSEPSANVWDTPVPTMAN